MIVPRSRFLPILLGILVHLTAVVAAVSTVNVSVAATSERLPSPHDVHTAGRDMRRTVRDSRTDRTPLGADVRQVYSSDPVVASANGDTMLAFPPAPRAAAQATFVYLHGIHGRADKGCPTFRSGASELGWLVCPEALVEGPTGFYSWGGDSTAHARVLESSVALARANGASKEMPVVIGFSQGSFVIVDLLETSRARARAVVLLGADVHPSVARLRDAGVERVVLGSGAKDAPYRKLRAEVARLEAEGMPARFVDLGRVGHTYATEQPEELRAALLWAGGV